MGIGGTAIIHDARTREVDWWRSQTEYWLKSVIYSYFISMAWCKTVVSPLLTHWRYCSLALNHRYDVIGGKRNINWWMSIEWRYLYSIVIFLQYTHNRHPISRPWERNFRACLCRSAILKTLWYCTVLHNRPLMSLPNPINADLLSIGPSWKFSVKFYLKKIMFSFKKMHLKMSSAKCRPFYSGLHIFSWDRDRGLPCIAVWWQ